jgi:hypothetical protein
MVHVVWEDAATYSGWTEVEHRDFPTSVCHSVGYLLSRTDATVVLALTLSDGGGASEIIALPAANIREMRELA